MLNKLRTAVVFCFLTTALVATAAAQTSQERFADFWTRFRTAVANRDAQAVAEITRLPFNHDSKSLDQAEYIRLHNRLFGKIRSCLAKAKPSQDGTSYTVFCGDLGLLFDKVGNEYKFVEFFVND